jgi:hypothetical protein
MKDPESVIMPTAILFLMVAGTFLILVSLVIDPKSDEPLNEETRFEVVTQYQGCDVVQYSPKGKSMYAYFLNCKTK